MGASRLENDQGGGDRRSYALLGGEGVRYRGDRRRESCLKEDAITAELFLLVDDSLQEGVKIDFGRRLGGS